MFFRLEEYPKMDELPDFRLSMLRDSPLMSGIFDFGVYDSISEDALSIQFRPLPFHRIRTVLVPTMRVVFSPFLKIAGMDNGKYSTINKINNEYNELKYQIIKLLPGRTILYS